MAGNFELVILSGGTAYFPGCVESVVWETRRKSSPGVLRFSIRSDGAAPLAEGDCVKLTADGGDVFWGYVFSASRGGGGKISAVAYDQLRYFKNKDSYAYEMKTAAEVLKTIVSDYGLRAGEICDTGYRIPSRIECGAALFDIIGNALDITRCNTGRAFVLYDDCGKINLCKSEKMRVDILIDEQCAESFELKSSIDSGVYNKVKISGSRENCSDFRIAQDEEKIAKWGVLQYYRAADKNADAAALLDLYSAADRSLAIKGAAGDVRVRGGSAVAVDIELGGTSIRRFVLVERARHEFREGIHLMDLECVI